MAAPFCRKGAENAAVFRKNLCVLCAHTANSWAKKRQLFFQFFQNLQSGLLKKQLPIQKKYLSAGGFECVSLFTHAPKTSRTQKKVEMPGVEPGSGQSANELSTCLSRDWVFGYIVGSRAGTDAPYPLKFSSTDKGISAAYPESCLIRGTLYIRHQTHGATAYMNSIPTVQAAMAY